MQILPATATQPSTLCGTAIYAFMLNNSINGDDRCRR